MHDLMESLTGDYTEEYTLYGGAEPSLKRVWSYKDEAEFLNDVEKLSNELGHTFYLSSWRIANTLTDGMIITFRTNITLDTYIARKRIQIQGAEIESEGE